jgi:hypothetical protein
VTDLLRRLNLTEEEGAVADFSDDEEIVPASTVEWALVGKVLSPSPVHVNTVRSAMKPAWGNPVGLKLRAIGEKADNLFVAEFGCGADLERVPPPGMQFFYSSMMRSSFLRRSCLTEWSYG